MVLGTGFLLLVSLIISAGLAAMGEFFTGLLPGGEVLLQIINFVVSLAVITVLFALIFKYILDAEIASRSTSSYQAEEMRFHFPLPLLVIYHFWMSWKKLYQSVDGEGSKGAFKGAFMPIHNISISAPAHLMVSVR